MSELIKPHFRLNSSFTNIWKDSIQTLIIGQDVDWTNDTLNLKFVGNRIDTVGDGRGSGTTTVRIDGRMPSDFPELYSFGRLPAYPLTSMSFLVSLDSEKPLMVEDWALSVLEFTNKPLFVRFRVDGSQTGFDGEGTSSKIFVSNSGRIVIHPESWAEFYWAAPTDPIPVGTRFTWQVLPHFQNDLTPSLFASSNEVSLASGLANGEHLLTLSGSENSGIRGFRIFNPQAMSTFHPPPQKVHLTATLNHEDSEVLIGVEGSERYVIEESPKLGDGTWKSVSAPLTGETIEFPPSNGDIFYRVRPLE
jgi:hypothetical protein